MIINGNISNVVIIAGRSGYLVVPPEVGGTISELYNSMGDNVAGTSLQGNPTQNWTQRANVGMGNKLRGDFAPNYWTPTNPAFKALVPWEAATCWFVAWPGVGHAATNTGINIKELEFWVQRESTGVWRLENVSSTEIGWPSVGGAVNTRVETDGSRSFFLTGDKNSGYVSGTPYAVHGSTPRFALIDGDDIRCVHVRLKYRLILENPVGLNDMADAQIYVNIGADPWPTMSTVTGDYAPMTYAPQVLSSRFELATASQRFLQAATINPPAQETGYPAGSRSISREEFSGNLPPSLSAEVGNPALFWMFSVPQNVINSVSAELNIQSHSGQVLHGEQASFRSLFEILTLSGQDVGIMGSTGSINVSGQSGYLISTNILNGITEDINIAVVQGYLESPYIIEGNIASIVLSEQQGYLVTDEEQGSIPIFTLGRLGAYGTGITINSNIAPVVLAEQPGQVIYNPILNGTIGSIVITEFSGAYGPGAITINGNIASVVLAENQGQLIYNPILNGIISSIVITEFIGSYSIGITINGSTTSVVMAENQGQVIYSTILNGTIENITIQGQQGYLVTGDEQAGFYSSITWMPWGLAAYGEVSNIINGSITPVTITEFSGSYGSDILISSTPDSILLTEQVGAVIQGTTIDSSIENIDIQGTQGQLSNQVLIESTIDTIIVQGEVGELNYSYTIEGILGSVSLTPWQGSVEYGYDTLIQGNAAILSITPSTGSVIGTIVINGIPDDIEVLGSNSEVYIENIFSGSIEGITIQEQQGSVIVQYILNGNIANLVIQEPKGYLIASNILLGNTTNISTQGTTGLVILGDTIVGNIGNTVITEQLGTLTISTIIDGLEDNIIIEGVTGIYYIPDTLPSPEPLRIILQRPESLKIII